MPISYYLQPNPITPDPSDQSARVITGQVYDLDLVIEDMLLRGTTVTRADTKAVIDVFFDVVGRAVANGNNVNLPIFNIKPGIAGVFNSATDSFDPSRHFVKANLSPGIMMNELMAAAGVTKVSQAMPQPVLIEYTDYNTNNTTNTVISPGGIGQLVGEELKFEKANPNEGIFFISEGGDEIKVTVISNRTEGKLVFLIPATLLPGIYTLEVRRGYGTSNVVLRKGSLSELLKVL